jgi:hypothetical protein
MKKTVIAIAALGLIIGHFSFAHAEYVSGYMKKDGTYVQGYQRSDPDSSPYDNYDYPGNYNPNTGEDTPGNDETYLNNYYNNSDTSSYVDTTPSCPDNAYESGNQCQCDSGYISQDGSCVDADSYCDDKHGYESTYDSSTDSCTCNDGYGMDSSGQCVNENDACENQIGYNSSYDSSDNTCSCDEGYVLNSDQTECISQDDYCQAQYGDNSSYDDSTDRCACDDGYTYQNGQCEEAEDDTPVVTRKTPIYIAPTPQPLISNANLTASAVALTPLPSVKSMFDVPANPLAPSTTSTAPTPPIQVKPTYHWYGGVMNFFKKLF